MDGGTTINPKETPCRLLVGVNAKNLTTLRMGYTRIEPEEGGQRRPKPPMAEFNRNYIEPMARQMRPERMPSMQRSFFQGSGSLRKSRP